MRLERTPCDSGAPSDWALARGNLAVLRRALEDDAAPHFLILEDDLRIARHLRHNLERWPPLRRGGLHFATLYNPGLRPSSRAERSAVEGPGAIKPAPPAETGTALPSRGPTWFAADPPACFGGQARIFSRECATFILEKMPGPGLQQDPQMARLAAELGPLWVHTPSLVQHTGRTSTWSAAFHQAHDFDPEWKAD